MAANGKLMKRENKVDDIFNDLFKIGENMFSSYTKKEYGYPIGPSESGLVKSQMEDKVIFVLPVPGCSEDDVSVTQKGRAISVKAEVESDVFESTYSTSFIFDDRVYDENKIAAVVENGLLTIIIGRHTKEERTDEGERKIL